MSHRSLDSSSNKDPNSAEQWQLVEPISPDGFVLIDDVVGLVMEFLEINTLLNMRLVCHRWHDHEVLCHWVCVIERMMTKRMESNIAPPPPQYFRNSSFSSPNANNSAPLNKEIQGMAQEAFEEVQRDFENFDFVEEPWLLRRQTYCPMYNRQHAMDYAQTSMNNPFVTEGEDSLRGDIELITASSSTEEREERLELLPSSCDMVQHCSAMPSNISSCCGTDHHRKRSGLVREAAHPAAFITVSVMEYERYFPLSGFKKKMLLGDPPLWKLISDAKRELHHGLEDVPLDEGWDWCSNWSPLIQYDPTVTDYKGLDPQKAKTLTDPEGWQYAFAFLFGSFGSLRREFVRRREWRRKMRLTHPLEMDSVPSSICNRSDE